MINVCKLNEKTLGQAINLRCEMLLIVNNLKTYVFNDEFKKRTEEYLKGDKHTTFLAMDGNQTIGCATVCYIDVMPTYEHPSGRRAHVMNVYVKKEYRGNGIAKMMIQEIIDDVKEKGVTHISLDATKLGRYVYEKFGFKGSDEYMELVIDK